MTGKNLTDDIGENGAGKSTFLDAITWCLYGRTTRGLKSGDILPWGSTGGASVTLDMTVEHRFTVKRTQKPNNLTLDDKPVDQEELHKTLRLNFDSFINSILSPQFGDSFFNLTASAKLTLFSNILELDFWLLKSKEAADLAASIEAEIVQTERTMAKAKERKDLFELSLGEMQTLHATFQNRQKVETADLEKAMRLANASIVSTEIEFDETEKLKRALLHRLKLATAEVTQAEGKVEAWLYNVQKYSAEAALWKAKLTEKVAAYENFNKIGGVCPCCGLEIPAQHKASHKLGLSLRIRNLEEDFKYSEEDRIGALENLVKAKANVNRHESEVDSIQDELNACNMKITRLESALKDTLEREKSLKTTLAKKTAETSPYKKLISEKREALQAASDKFLSSKKRLNVLEAEHAATVFWVKGFKRIRLFTIEQTFRTLELEVNNCLAQLGLPNWQITFDIERENKKGGLTKGFVVFIQSPKNTEPVKWECWSGGETQRLQLAGSLGLSNLIMQQAGLTNTFECFDEPSKHLSHKGMMDLADMLHERAKAESKTIWLVDHTAASNFGSFEEIITVRKDENGSSIKRG